MMREYLDKQKLLMALNDKYRDMSAMPASYYAGFQYAIKLIEKLHVNEEVAPMVHGRWNGYTTSAFYGTDDFGEPIYRDATFYCCSICNRKSIIKEKFCPKCGAKMDLEDEK